MLALERLLRTSGISGRFGMTTQREREERAARAARNARLVRSPATSVSLFVLSPLALKDASSGLVRSNRIEQPDVQRLMSKHDCFTEKSIGIDTTVHPEQTITN